METVEKPADNIKDRASAVGEQIEELIIDDVTSSDSDKEEIKKHDVAEEVQLSSNTVFEIAEPPFTKRLALTKTLEPPAFNLLRELQNLYVKIPLLQALRDVPIHARTM
jgi:hypothetical protein